MPRQIPFVVAIKETTTNGGTLSFFYKAPNGQDFKIHAIQWVIGAAFNLNKVLDDRGQYYSQASSTDPIPSSQLKVASTNVNLLDFPRVPLLLKAGTQIELEITDTGGGGAVTCILDGELTVPD